MCFTSAASVWNEWVWHGLWTPSWGIRLRLPIPFCWPTWGGGGARESGNYYNNKVGLSLTKKQLWGRKYDTKQMRKSCFFEQQPIVRWQKCPFFVHKNISSLTFSTFARFWQFRWSPRSGFSFPCGRTFHVNHCIIKIVKVRIDAVVLGGTMLGVSLKLNENIF